MYLYRQQRGNRLIVDAADTIPADALPRDADYPRAVAFMQEGNARDYAKTWARDWAAKAGQTVEARIRGRVIARYPE